MPLDNNGVTMPENYHYNMTFTEQGGVLIGYDAEVCNSRATAVQQPWQLLFRGVPTWRGRAANATPRNWRTGVRARARRRRSCWALGRALPLCLVPPPPPAANGQGIAEISGSWRRCASCR